MKKNDVFTFTAPNGVEVTAVVINELSYRVMAGEATTTWICYAQNKLFIKATHIVYEDGEYRESDTLHEREVVDYAILPDYDELLARYNDLEVTQAETAAGM